MTEIAKILVPVDFSANTEKLLDFAAFFAKKFGATLSLLNVVENPAAYEGYFVAKIEEDIRAAMAQKMTALLEKYPGSSGEVLIGDTVDTITTLARRYDLVIIGTHGYRGLEKIVMGSVAERVVKNASCPVLVFNPYK
ncbi:MAG: universal stress protein [Thermodesulfobacteriota bacterium]